MKTVVIKELVKNQDAAVQVQLNRINFIPVQAQLQ